ncbi:A-kinase anchor protein 6-like [Parambassis ranga]|uniref:A-kinase anchor protein 6-like n=1 Tax=Parambassis ranga TaxID=210632 RepID=A0A6P7HND2_9TELE|nr:A-kinase anchor protein 6-like [Parambassis ranga]
MAEVGPDAEQHREALQLLSINLERRWEAIVMQALQWQNRLRREQGEQQVSQNLLEPGLVDLQQISPVSAGPVGPAPDDSWEWDETDMTITEAEPAEAPEPDLTHSLPAGNPPIRPEASQGVSEDQSRRIPQSVAPNINNNNVYQVYSLHQVELYKQPQFPRFSTPHRSGKRKLLLKSLSKDSSFSSIESLPDLLGGLMSSGRGGQAENEGGRGSGQSANSRRSESESGIVSDTGDTTTTNSETQGEEEEEQRKDNHKYRSRRKEELRGREEEKRRRPRRGGGEAVEILINGRVILTPADSDSDFEVGGLGRDSIKVEQDGGRAPSPVLSQGSSLESLLALGVELFPSKDPLQRSASLESGLGPCCGADAEQDPGQRRGSDAGEGQEKKSEQPPNGELSLRTLDLLRRLENIQSPLAAKMTRSVSDMTLRSSSPQTSRLPASPSLGGRHAPLSGISRKGPPSLINEGSATASLTELSSAEDSSVGSEDFARNQRHLFLDPFTTANANAGRQRYHGNSRGGQGADEADAASLSMVVNVSSACTDEDEDDSDLLSSSTLTLTEEELGVREGEDEEEDRLSGASSGNEEDEDDDDEEEMEGSYVLGLEYMKRELQSWIRSPRTSSSSSKTEAGLRDELQCGTFTSSCQNQEQRCFLNQAAAKLLETNSGNNRGRREQEEEEENRRNATRSFISQFVDDVENGNVEQSGLKGKDEDDELLREEASVFTKKGESVRESYVFTNAGETVQDESDSTKQLRSPSSEPLPTPSNRASSLVGQLSGELPCHSSSLPSPPSLSPMDDHRSCTATHGGRPAASGRKAITAQEKFKFSAVVTEETRREVRDKDSSLPSKKWHGSHSTCCKHLPTPASLHPHSADGGGKENVHDFVMEIIDMTSEALRSKESEDPRPTETEQSPASLTQIRDKVLEHSHRPLHLRKGDFYSYLSLSSHDSDCGEVSQCVEEKSSTPAPYSLPSYATPTQGLHSPEPLVDTPPSRLCALDLQSADRQAVSAAGEEAASPSLSLPPSPDIRDEETLFAACTEEVYLGPPLCYSMVLTKRPRRLLKEGPASFLPSELNSCEAVTAAGVGYLSASPPPPPPPHASSEEEWRGEDPYLLCDVAASVSMLQEEGSRNEGPPYLNPRARVGPIDSSAAECLADTETLESNMGAVMTKISVCGSATNPSKEPAATAMHINPKINRWPMREADRGERESRGEGEAEEKGRRRGRSGAQQEAKAARQVSSRPAVSHTRMGRSHGSVRPATLGTVQRPAVLGASRIQL